ncbi:uncharacterized protein LOC114254295 isoform X2 [Monomorium pharaonis]|uniref:uncharacterized protein LOC114254295 isoform X2 n=1 Tax=Monomorium pharaonis TaxID=307658 RepID=UPI0017467426|nr:uncharacterized protein LOC114254295 isoform X2 [Monomorium pharaonis]XP_036141307.1 uncharacterized protein LOC114254295 isoform X2 [Monomorium pharaonis]
MEHDNHSNKGIAVLTIQKIIHDPSNMIVRHQIPGNMAKMLVMSASGEQKLITFDIPNEDCTVQDLLDQVDISFSDEMQISLVHDPAFDINYIVDAVGSGVTSLDGDCNSSQEIASTAVGSENLPQIINASDENSNTSSQTCEERILVEGMLALCPHCGYSSLYFNRCERCNTKLKIEEVESKFQLR